MRKFILLLLSIMALTLTLQTNAFASGGVGVGAKVGTLGFGVDVNYPINSFLTVGVGLNKYTYTADQTQSNINYHSEVDLQTLGVMANIHPFAGSFHITAALMQNNNKFNMTAHTTTNSYDINGTAYPANYVGTLKGTVDFRKISPYAGVGWGGSAGRGLGFTFDVGVLMQGKPNVSLSASGAAASDPTFQQDLKQQEASTENDIKGFTNYYVISFGLDFRI
jgi:hypothetical protein